MPYQLAHRPQAKPADDRFRPDIEGLRAVAIAAVVLFHAGVGWLGGGYVGVDVFFVISGFLITDLLWRGISERGGVSFSRFYSRRARRLLPASMLVLVVTMAASARWLPPLEMTSVWKDGLASALYVGNYRFALTETNYLASTAPPSPFQHYWSLGVEEQFYLVWPLLVVLATRLGKWRGSPRATAATLLTVVAACSFAASVYLTRVNEPWAFFSLPTRAWELAVGGLVALAAPTLRRLLRTVAAPLGWLGLGLIVWSAVALSSSSAFPGFVALAPVGGAVAVVAAGLPRPSFGVERLLGLTDVRLVGRISYSLYLWHWPVLILAPDIVGHALDLRQNLGLVALSVALAAMTYLLVESPGRRWRWAAISGWRTAALGGSLTTAGAAACVVAATVVPATLGHGQAPVASLHTASGPPAATAGAPLAHRLAQRSGATTAPDARIPPNTVPPNDRGVPATVPPTTTIPPAVAHIDALTAQVSTAVSQSAGDSALPANLNPPLEDAAGDEPDVSVDGCLLSYTTTVSPECLFGDPSGSKAIVLFGDSHANMWFSAANGYAESIHARLYVWTKATCPPVDLPMFSPVLGREFSECDQWREDTLQRIQALHPELVIFGTAPNYDSAYDITQDGPQWLSGLRSEIAQVRHSGARVVVFGPVPSPPESIPDCLSANPDDLSACNVAPGEAHVGIGLVGYDTAGLVAERSATTRAGATFVDVEPWFCTASTCPAVVDNLLVYRDNSHITDTYAQYLAPLVSAELAAAGR